MKHKLIVDVDSNRKPPVHITKAITHSPHLHIDGLNPGIADLAILTEALASTIIMIDMQGIQNIATSLKQTISHLEKLSFSTKTAISKNIPTTKEGSTNWTDIFSNL